MLENWIKAQSIWVQRLIAFLGLALVGSGVAVAPGLSAILAGLGAIYWAAFIAQP